MPIIKACQWCGKPLDESTLCPQCKDDLECICHKDEHEIWCPASLLEEKENEKNSI